MIYQSERMTLCGVMDVFRGKVNDVVICEEVKGGRTSYYTLVLVKNHDTVRRLIRILERSEKSTPCMVDSFSWNNCFCLVFDYVKARPLSEFFMGAERSLEECESICINLLLQCMTSPLPWPLLKLAIRQQIHLLKDGDVRLGYELDLKDLDENCTEKQCVMECAMVIRDLLKEKLTQKNVSYQLLMKKIPRQGYQNFRDLYRDIRLSSSMVGKRSLRARILGLYREHQATIYKALLVVSVFLLILTVSMMISQRIWGEVPFLRILFNNFKQIGTESLIR